MKKANLKPITVRLPPKIYRELQKSCKDSLTDRSLAEHCRRILTEYVVNNAET